MASVVKRLLRLSPQDAAWILVVAVLVFLSIRGETARRNAINANRATITAVAKTNQRQRAAIVLLCDRGHILDGLVVGAIQLVKTPPHKAGDAEFIAKFTALHIALINQLTDPRSPCAEH